MNKVCPLRSCLHSASCGSLTFTTRSAAAKTSCGALRDDGAGRLVVRILEPDARAGAALHQHLMSGIDEFANARGHQADPVLVNFDLFGDADFHVVTAPLGQMWIGQA